MQNSTPHEPLGFFSLARAGLASALAILLLGATAPPLAAQSDNFNDGNDAGWTHYSITGFYNPAFPGGYCPYGGTTYTFPNDGSGGYAYHLDAAPTIWSVTGTDAYGVMNARGGSYLPTPTYTNRFKMGTDLLAWSTTGRPTMGLMWYVHDIYLGSTDGYCGTFSPNYRNIYISIVANEDQAAYCGRLVDGDITLDSSDRIRMEASSHDGSTFVLTVYNKLEPNTPWGSAIGQDTTYFGVGGSSGYLMFNEDYPADYGASATFDNYVATEPAAGTMPAMVTDVYPPPAGKATALYPTVTVMILDRDTTVNSSDANSFALCLDGVWLPQASLGTDWQIISGVQKPTSQTGPTSFNGATVTYPITNLFAWGSKHTNIIAFKDSAETWRTNTWTWTIAYPYLFASNSLPIGSLSVRGFDVRMAQTTNGGVNLDNSLARARQQLDGLIPVDQRATSIVQVLNWNKNSAYPDNVPGLCPGDNSAPINIAAESCAYLQLTAGPHRFHINTDDRSGVYSGVNLTDTSALWEAPSSTADTTFEFVVEADGLYPIRVLWEETGGSAVLHLWSTNLLTADPEVLINDPSDPTGVVKAWYPVVCKSSASVAGPYTLATTAANVLNTADILGVDCGPVVVGQKVTGGTLTIPISGTMQFYRLDAPRKTTITNITKSGSNVVITYQLL
jgi:hypothetical protein